ncbi:cation:proton antiporter [Muricoccus radiodurans]|uniref:cation:proton antiporter n=1 Tax=Muricoccus radiodurans TaxID=2231721 RepID=UPI003CE90E12
MEVFETVIALLLAAAVLSAWADRIGAPYPALLALAGTLAAFVPGLPVVTLDPALALALFVAPTLLDSAYDASPRDLRANLRSVASLALVAVGLTIVSVACVARWLIPEMPWGAAIALGAIVAPPDASAASAVLRRLRPPHQLLVILEGESLFNDASALLVYRLAVAAAITGSFSAGEALPALLVTAGGGALFGWLAARAYIAFARLFRETAISVLLQFLGTFGVWIAAEALHLSAIITVVAYAMTLARIVPRRISARRRIASYAVWEVAVFVLNALAFLLIGLQLKAILARMDGEWAGYALLALAVSVAVILTRLAWVMAGNAVLRWHHRHFGARRGQPRPTVGAGVLLAWAGMRGTVTLATAFALPDGFPQRDAIVFAAFWVVLATLVLQGLTLGPLLRRLGLADDGTVEREIALAREATARAALRLIDSAPPGEERDLLRREYAARAEGKAPQDGAPPALSVLQHRAVAAQRDHLEALRGDGTIGDDAFHAIEEELDLLELTADPRVRTLGAASSTA